MDDEVNLTEDELFANLLPEPSDNQDEPEQDEPSEDDEPEAQDEQPAEEAEEEKPAEESSERVLEWTTKAGESFKVTEQELKDGYMRQQDYTRESQRLVDERKRAESDVLKQAGEVKDFAKEIGRLESLRDQLAQFDSISWSELDRETSVGLQLRKLELTQQVQVAESEVRRRSSEYEATLSRAYADGVAQSEQRLQQKFKSATIEDAKGMFEMLMAAGASDVDIHQIKALPWAVEIAMRAYTQQKFESKKPELAKKASAIPTKPKAAPRVTTTRGAEAINRVIKSDAPIGQGAFLAALRNTR